MGKQEQYDYGIIGGGIFGVYAALHFARKGHRVCLIEKETGLFRKASIVNQARLHTGYHYPRSVATARMSNDHRERFSREHAPFVNHTFEKYYAVDRYGSFTDPVQFERFCAFVDIPCERVTAHELFNFQRIAALYRTEEHSFDPILIAQYYKEKIRNAPNCSILLRASIEEVQQDGGHWLLRVQQAGQTEQQLRCARILNATYAGSNGINALFGVQPLQLVHEISEIAFITAPAIQHLGLTVMDGPFGSIMPYGKSGLLSVSSVAYTHHKVSYENQPQFDCQALRADCRPDFLADCNTCSVRPHSNQNKMLRQMGQYFSEKVEWQYFRSFFTIKSKLKASHIDDGRPTEIRCLHENPHFYCIFAGKINSIYEVEKID